MKNQVVLYGNPTLSDLDFMMKTHFSSFPSSASDSSSSILSDAQSAAPDLSSLLNQLCDEYNKHVRIKKFVVGMEGDVAARA